MLSSDIIRRYRVSNAKKFRLSDYDPADTCGLDIEKSAAKALLASGIKRLAELQERLYAEHRWAVLAIFQAMDAGGKDSVIKHVMSGVNPQGCRVHAFKAPTSQELEHDFLWRAAVRLPERGHIGIFNRSYYEEVLVVRLHPEWLARQNLPPALVTGDIWKQRFADIRAFESYLARNGTAVLKFHLRISHKEQKRRFLERLDDPSKRWKFAAEDLAERELWDRYMEAYEHAIGNTATLEAPWYVVPADNKWFARLAVAAAMVEALETINPQFPSVDAPALRKMRKARAKLLAEKRSKR
jgi:PPK2 family polyphosphate:nucleotide phosphotransferase